MNEVQKESTCLLNTWETCSQYPDGDDDDDDDDGGKQTSLLCWSSI